MSENWQSRASVKHLTYTGQSPHTEVRPRVRRSIPTYTKPQEHICVCKNRAVYA